MFPTPGDAQRAPVTPRWSVVGVVGDALRAWRRHPLPILVALGVIPIAWALPVSYASHVLISRSEGLSVLASDPTMWAVSLAWATTSSVVLGGEVLIALGALRGERPRLGRFVSGLRFAPRLFLWNLWTALVSAIVTKGPWIVGDAANLVLTPFVSFAVLRLWLIVPLVVDQRMRLREAAVASWRATRHQFWALVRLGLVYVALASPMALSWASEGFVFQQVLLALTTPVWSLSLARAYVAMAPSNPPTETPLLDLEQQSTDAELPVRGSGWASSVRPKTEPE